MTQIRKSALTGEEKTLYLLLNRNGDFQSANFDGNFEEM
jgi:hypothetical protein